jgi:hypothetical protein
MRRGRSGTKATGVLDGPIPWLNEEFRAAGTVHVGGRERVLGFRRRPARRPSRAPVRAPRPAERHRPKRSGAQAHRLGLRRPVVGADWAAHSDRMDAQLERFASRLPRPHPRLSRADQPLTMSVVAAADEQERTTEGVVVRAHRWLCACDHTTPALDKSAQIVRKERTPSADGRGWRRPGRRDCLPLARAVILASSSGSPAEPGRASDGMAALRRASGSGGRVR